MNEKQPIEKAASRKYLEEVLALAKKHLPLWAYATIHAQARNRSGGLSSRKVEAPNALEKMGLKTLKAEVLKEMETAELKDSWAKFEGWHKNAVIRKKDVNAIIAAAKLLKEELGIRKEKVKASPLVSAIEKEDGANELIDFLNSMHSVKKSEIRVFPADGESNEFRETNSESELRAAVRWAFDVEKSQGAIFQGVGEKLHRLPKHPELVVKVLERHAREERAQYVCGLLPIDDECSNIVKFEDDYFVRFGKTHLTMVHAEPGDLLTISAPNVFYNSENKELTGLGLSVTNKPAHRTSPDVTTTALSTIETASALNKSLAISLTSGPTNAKVAFVGASPSSLEVVRKEHFIGEMSSVMLEKYLKPLGLIKADVLMTNIIPEAVEGEISTKEIEKWEGWAHDEIVRENPSVVIALGRLAKDVLGDMADFVLPHPALLVRKKDSGEVARKLKQAKALIVKKLDSPTQRSKYSKSTRLNTSGRLINKSDDHSSQNNLADSKSEPKESKSEMLTTIAKAEKLKHIVYGVVMDPYGKSGSQPDAHSDFIPPDTIEETAHDYMDGKRAVGIQHMGKANAKVVESHIEQYPTPAEYQKALLGQDHKVTRRQFGDDVIHSGSWVVGVKLGAEEWASYERGELNAFSPGGFGYRTPITPRMMPKVSFVDLVEKDA